MKKISIIFYLLLITFSGFSQNTFNLHYGNATRNEWNQQVIETTAGDFIAGFNTSPYPYNAVFLKISETGTITLQKQFDNRVLYGIKEKMQSYFCFGVYLESPDSMSFFAMYLDDNFNIISEKRYQIPDFKNTDELRSDKAFIEKNDTFYCLVSRGTPTTYGTHHPHGYYFILSEQCDSLKSGIIGSGSVTPYGICQNPKTDGFLVTGSDFDDISGPGQLGFLDKDLNFIESKHFAISPYMFFLQIDISLVGENIIAASNDLGTYQSESQISAVVFDTSMTTYAFSRFGKPELRCNAARTNGLLVDSFKNIYISGTVGYSGWPFQIDNNWIVIAKTDSLLVTKWEKFYGGDAYYDACDMSLCSNGGLILSAARYDENLNNNEFDGYIFKVDSAGNGPLLSDTKKNSVNVCELIIYPNPGTAEITVRTASQALGGEFILCDILGKQVFQTSVKERFTSVSTNTLPEGVYVYKYILNGKIKETGKWVKAKK